MRRLAVLLFAVPSLLFAQHAESPRIAPVGADVRVFTKQNTVAGVLRRVSGEGIGVEVGGSTLVNIDAADIVDMDARLPDGRTEGRKKEGMFWGFMVGAIVGAAAPVPECSDNWYDTSKPPCHPIVGPSFETGSRVGGAFVVGLLGIAVGGFIGAHVKHPRLSWVRVRVDSTLAQASDAARH